MKTQPQRVAIAAIVLALLAGAVAWWWSLVPIRTEVPVAVPAASVGVQPGKAHPSATRAQLRTGQSQAVEQCGKAMTAALRAHAVSLKQRQDAQSQLAYALTAAFTVFGEIEQAGPGQMDGEAIERRFKEQRAESQAAFARARALAPDNPDILWLAAIQCGVDDTCQGVRQQLLEAEPDNAAAWLYEMSWARMRNDTAGAERAFRRVADAPRFDRHTGASQFAILESFSRVSMPVECEAEDVQAELQRLFGQGKVEATDFVLVVASSLAGMEVPAYMPIREHCAQGEVSGTDKARRSACGRVLEKMAGSDVMIDQAIALGMLVELAGDGDDAVRWRERYRNHHWLRSHMGKPALRALTAEDYAFDESGAMQRALEAKGLWPAPPGWLPDDEHARSLILTGRPPAETKRK